MTFAGFARPRLTYFSLASSQEADGAPASSTEKYNGFGG